MYTEMLIKANPNEQWYHVTSDGKRKEVSLKAAKAILDNWCTAGKEIQKSSKFGGKVKYWWIE